MLQARERPASLPCPCVLPGAVSTEARSHRTPENDAWAEIPSQQWAAGNPRMQMRGSPCTVGSRACALGLGLNPGFSCNQP